MNIIEILTKQLHTLTPGEVLFAIPAILIITGLFAKFVERFGLVRWNAAPKAEEQDSPIPVRAALAQTIIRAVEEDKRQREDREAKSDE